MRSISAARVRNSKRALGDAADQVLVREPSLCRCGSVFRIHRKIRVWVYVDDEGYAGRIDTKIDARIVAKPEQSLGGQRELLKRVGQFGLVPFQTAAFSGDIGCTGVHLAS